MLTDTRVLSPRVWTLPRRILYRDTLEAIARVMRPASMQTHTIGRLAMSKRFIFVQSCKTDYQWDWYIIDLVSKSCVDRVACGFDMVSDRVERMNREAR